MTGADILSGIIGAVITVVVGLVIVGIQQWFKRRVKVTGASSEVAQIRPLVSMLVDIQKPQLVALLAIIGALKEKMNGDFERADRGVREALDTFDGTLKAIATGKCVEEHDAP